MSDFLVFQHLLFRVFDLCRYSLGPCPEVYRYSGNGDEGSAQGELKVGLYKLTDPWLVRVWFQPLSL
jgi:hypothetical protein